MEKILKTLLRYKYIFFLLLFYFLAVKPLMHAGLPPTHDGEYHVVRFYEFDKAIRDGNLYPRWASDLNNGYGVPLFNYVYPLPNYFAALFHFFGMSFIDAFKMNLLFATFVGVFFFYLWARLFFSNIAALTASVFYAFSPYRFVDIYVRGSVGEVWALACFPAFLWAITSLIQKRKMRYLILSSVFFAGTIFSHNILGLMFATFSITYVLFLLGTHKWEKKLFVFSVTVFLLGLSLSAIFWLPALVETQYVRGLQIYEINENFPELYQLLLPSWGTGFSGGSLQNQMSFQIGVANLVVTFTAFVLLVRYAKKKIKHKGILVFCLLWFILVFYLMLPVSEPLWQNIPLLNYFQFPWRLLSLMILLCSFIAAAVIHMISGEKRSVIISSIFIALAVMLALSYTQPAYYHYRNDAHYLTRDNFIHGTNSPGNMFNTIWMNDKLALKDKKIEIIQGKAKIKPDSVESKTSTLKFVIEAATPSKLVVNIAYFPGWTLSIDGVNTKLDKTKDGIITFSVPKGEHSVAVNFNDTMIRKVGALISLAALIICVGLVVARKK